MLRRLSGPAVAFCAFAALVMPASADERDRDAVLDQLQAKYSTCVAYYGFVRDCGRKGDVERRLHAVRTRAKALAEAIALSPDAAALRLELGELSNRSLTGGCEGLAVLEARFANECEVLSAAPD